MTPPQALHSLLSLAERERNDAMSETQRVQMEHRNAQRQVEQLLAYRSDYEQRWSHRFSGGGEIAIVQCYQGFMDRLGDAIRAQEHVAALVAQRLARAQVQLQQHEMRVASIRKLIERRSAENRGVEARRDQKQSDEQAMRAAWQRRAGAALLPT
jgi:flagellar protein FliJ